MLLALAVSWPGDLRAGGAAQAQLEPATDNPETDLLWADVEHRSVAFVPGSVLLETPIDQLPLDRVARDILRSTIAKAPAAGAEGSCLDVMDTLSIGGKQGRPQILPRSESQEASPLRRESSARPRDWLELRGTVERVVVGWSPTFMKPASLVVVELDAVLDGGSSSLNRGDRVSVLIPEATLEIEGKVLCSKAGKLLGLDDPVPAPGEAVVVHGRIDPANYGFVQHVDGTVRRVGSQVREKATVEEKADTSSCVESSPTGAWFPGPTSVQVVYTPHFAQESTGNGPNALNTAILAWGNACPPKPLEGFPRLETPQVCGGTNQPSCLAEANKVVVHFENNKGPNICPNDPNGPCHPAALANQASGYIILYENFQNSGGAVQTLALNDPDVPNLIAHEIGHVYGLGEGSCVDSSTGQNGIMTYPISASSKILSTECSRAREISRGTCTHSNLSPVTTRASSFKTHCLPDDRIADKPELCTIVPELCIESSPGVNNPWWTVPNETAPDCYLAIVEVDGVTTVQRHCDGVGGGGGPAFSDSTSGPASGFHQPEEGAIVGGTVQLDGWSLDDDGGVTGTLGFWLDGQPALVTGATYGEHDAVACSGRVDPACPYVGFSGALDTTVLADGTHTIELVTSETAPERPTPGYADSTFVVDNTRPTASITAPSASATVSGTVSVTASASDTNGINLVSFYVDGAYQATDSTSPYSFSWSSGDWANGSHALKIVAWDEAGNSRTVTRSVTVSNDLQTPQVSVTLPANGALVRGTVTFRAVATDDQGVSYVELYRDGVLVKTDPVLPYQWAWETTAGPDGSYTLTARAYDAGGNVGVSAPVTVTVDNTLPSRYVDIPSHQQSVEGTSARIAGWAIDSSGITSHTFAIDGQPLAVTDLVTNLSRSGVCAAYPSIQDPACPYVGWRANFDATQFSNGPHTLTLTVQDSAGNVDSFARQLVIDNPASMAVFHPVADATAWQAYPTNNTGMSTILATRTTSGGEGAYSFLKFDVSGITGTVVSAQLEFRTDGSMYDLWLYWLTSNAWTEGSITWSSFPGPGGTLDYRYNLAASTWYSYDVSSFVTGNGTYSMGFAGSNSSYAYVWSRESSFSPVLRVSYLP